MKAYFSKKIKRLVRALPVDQGWQESVIDFFKAHANLESKINWNKKDKNEIVDDIERLCMETEEKAEKKKSEKQVYKSLPKFGEGWKVFKETDDWIFAMPLTWEACKYADATECGGEGAKWCIGYEKNDEYFNKYVYER